MRTCDACRRWAVVAGMQRNTLPATAARPVFNCSVSVRGPRHPKSPADTVLVAIATAHGPAPFRTAAAEVLAACALGPLSAESVARMHAARMLGILPSTKISASALCCAAFSA